MQSAFPAIVVFLFALVSGGVQDQNKVSQKESGHEFKFTASPDQCTDVLYKDISTGIEKDAGGATPTTVRLSPKLYVFTCKCPSGDVVSNPTMIGQVSSYQFLCQPRTQQAALQRNCDINTSDSRNVNDNKRIGDQDLFHIRCSTPGKVLTATYNSCNWAGGEVCTHINARNELSGPCKDDPKSACIYYQTNDGNFKVIHGTYTYMPE